MAKGKVANALARLKKAKDENETLKKAGAALKRVNTEENRQRLMVGGGAAAVGGIAGYKGQEYLQAADSPVPENVAVIAGQVPLGTVVGVVLMVYGAAKLRGQAQAAVSGFGGGMAGGAFVYKLANEA